ncbi:TVP38/TMEM64 family protein [Altericista sp. CCNU0014]|uniref:TVP38/TMEM64 family protein n=1 Tax=Altericista sp. CCNU0014 TaxID=3082949 RepID=UPI0038512B41
MRKRPFLSKYQLLWILLALVCLLLTWGIIQALGGYKPEQLQTFIRQLGIWGPLAYIALYVAGTLALLPSTPLNISGGMLFGPWWGILWTSVGAVGAATIAFFFSRTVGRPAMERRLAGRWQAMDAEIHRGGLFYMFAIRLIPVMPYGIVNFAAGLTSIRFRDFSIGTLLGTVPSVLPFVLVGSSSFKALTTGNLWPLLGALGLTGALVLFSTWFKAKRRIKV